MHGDRALIRLAHHRWTIPLLAELHRTAGSRFAAMANRLGISRDTLSKTLQDMVKAGWVRRNPGYGHPLRPEYILTTEGTRLAPGCTKLLQAAIRWKIEEVILRKWSLPVTAAIADGHARFADLKKALPGVTSRALAMALKDLEEGGLLERAVVDAFPPTTRYTLTARGRTLAKIMNRILM